MTDTPTASALRTHEAVCAERYKNILTTMTGMSRRVGRLENLVWAVAGSLILGMAGLIVTLFLTRAAHAHDDTYTHEENELLGELRTPQGMVDAGGPAMCCNVSDCKKTDDRLVGDHYEAWIDERYPGVTEARWEVVPATAILQNVRNPMGSAVACFYEGRIICSRRAVEACPAGAAKVGRIVPALRAPASVAARIWSATRARRRRITSIGNSAAARASI